MRVRAAAGPGRVRDLRAQARRFLPRPGQGHPRLLLHRIRATGQRTWVPSARFASRRILAVSRERAPASDRYALPHCLALRQPVRQASIVREENHVLVVENRPCVLSQAVMHRPLPPCGVRCPGPRPALPERSPAFQHGFHRTEFSQDALRLCLKTLDPHPGSGLPFLQQPHDRRHRPPPHRRGRTDRPNPPTTTAKPCPTSGNSAISSGKTTASNVTAPGQAPNINVNAKSNSSLIGVELRRRRTYAANEVEPRLTWENMLCCSSEWADTSGRSRRSGS